MHRQEDEHESFVAFLDQRLKTALTFEEYPLADRILAAQILASKGLLRTVTPVELNLPADVFNFDAAKKLRENPEMIMALKTESAKEAHISLSELADLDRKSTRLNSSHMSISYAVFCLKKKKAAKVESSLVQYCFPLYHPAFFFSID